MLEKLKVESEKLLARLMICLMVISIITMAFSSLISRKLGLVDKSYKDSTYVRYQYNYQDNN